MNRYLCLSSCLSSASQLDSNTSVCGITVVLMYDEIVDVWLINHKHCGHTRRVVVHFLLTFLSSTFSKTTLIKKHGPKPLQTEIKAGVAFPRWKTLVKEKRL